jgi:lactaldehyde dehydrogenase/glycolaldehyde dehydrogenase
VDAAVKRGISDGCQLLLGGAIDESKMGYHYQPTLLSDCPQKSAIMQEEVFGPVLPVATFSTLDEALSLANDCEYGLTSSIFTRDLSAAMRAANELKFGETYVNREHFEAMQGFHAGWRKSGIGGADGPHGFDEYTQTRAVYLNHDTRKQ